MEREVKEYQKIFKISIIAIFSVLAVAMTYYYSKAPYLLDDVYNLGFNSFKEINLSDPAYARGPVAAAINMFLLQYVFNSGIAHVFIIIAHILNSYLLATFACKIFQSNKIEYKMLCAIAFMVNPFALESLIWITAAYPVFLVFFALISLKYLINIIEEPENNGMSYVLHFLFATLTYLSNEQGFFFGPVFLPIYLYIVVKNMKKIKIGAIIKHSFLYTAVYMFPYILYRIGLAVIFSNKSAVHPYQMNFESMGLVYKEIVKMLIMYTPICLYIMLIFISIYFLFTTNKKRYIKENKICILAVLISVPIYIAIFMLPFSLLGGYLPLRYFYISSKILIFGILVIIGMLVKHVANSEKIKYSHKINLMWASLIITCLSGGIYWGDILLPIKDVRSYTETFYEQQKQMYDSVNENTICLIKIEREMPKMLYRFPGKTINNWGYWFIQSYFTPAVVIHAGNYIGYNENIIDIGLINVLEKDSSTNTLNILDSEVQLKRSLREYFEEGTNIKIYNFDGISLQEVDYEKLAIYNSEWELIEEF